MRVRMAEQANLHKKYHDIMTKSYLDAPIKYLVSLHNNDNFSEAKDDNQWVAHLSDSEIQNEIKNYRATIDKVESLIKQYTDYDALLDYLPPSIVSSWQEVCEDSPEKETITGLLDFLDYNVLKFHRVHLHLLEHHLEIKFITYGTAYLPNKFDMSVLQYEQILNNKFEKTLAMLLKLKGTQENIEVEQMMQKTTLTYNSE